MKTIYLTKLEGAKFSQAEIFLANKLRTLKSYGSDKNDFIKRMTGAIDGKEFSKSEALRIWDAMHSVTFYDKDADHYLTGMDEHHKLLFKAAYYRNNSNFFEDYAHRLLEEGEIIVHTGRPKGYTSPAIRENLAKMRAAKAAKKAQLSKEQETPKEETPVEDTPTKINLFNGLSLDAIREAQNQLSGAILVAQAEEKRKAGIRHQYETLRAAADKLLAENPWLDQQ